MTLHVTKVRKEEQTWCLVDISNKILTFVLFMQEPKLESVLFYQIEQAMRQSVRYTHRVFSEANVDLTKDQWLVLKKVNDEDSVSPLEIARLLGKEAASMTRILDILERKGLLIRSPNPADRRSSIISATPSGEQLFQQVLPLVQGIRDQAVSGFSSAEIQQLKNALQKISDNLN